MNVLCDVWLTTRPATPANEQQLHCLGLQLIKVVIVLLWSPTKPSSKTVTLDYI